MSESEWITIARPDNRADAYLLKGKLEAEGVEVYLEDEDTAGLYGDTHVFKNYSLMVPPDQEQEARDILHQLPFAEKYEIEKEVSGEGLGLSDGTRFILLILAVGAAALFFMVTTQWEDNGLDVYDTNFSRISPVQTTTDGWSSHPVYTTTNGKNAIAIRDLLRLGGVPSRVYSVFRKWNGGIYRKNEIFHADSSKSLPDRSYLIYVKYKQWCRAKDMITVLVSPEKQQNLSERQLLTHENRIRSVDHASDSKAGAEDNPGQMTDETDSEEKTYSEVKNGESPSEIVLKSIRNNELREKQINRVDTVIQIMPHSGLPEIYKEAILIGYEVKFIQNTQSVPDCRNNYGA